MKSMFLIMSLVLVGVLCEVPYKIDFRLNLTDTGYLIDASTITNFTEEISLDTFFVSVNATFNGSIMKDSEERRPVDGTILIDSPIFRNMDNIKISGKYIEKEEQVTFEGFVSLGMDIKRPRVPLEGILEFGNGTITDIEGEIYNISRVE